MKRPGDDHRHRLDRLSGRVGARPGGQDQGARRLEGDDDDVHLRPPRSSRAPSRARSCAGSTSCSRARTSFYEARRRGARDPHQPGHQRPSGLGVGPAAERRRRAVARRAPSSAPSPTARSCRRSRRRPRCSRPTAPTATWRRDGQPARRRAEGRPGARAREPQPDARADVADPGLDPADRRRGRDPARRAAADARRLLRRRSPTRSSTSPRIEQRMWLREMIETGWHRTPLSADEKRDAARSG